MTDLKHIVRFERGYDCIRFLCANKKNRCKNEWTGHGRHGLQIRFVAQGSGGAVQFVVATPWLPQHAFPDDIGRRSVEKWDASKTLPMDLGYHSKKPRHEDQAVMRESCEYCGGQPCYSDGSGLNANDAMYALVNGGDEALWAFLDAYYQTVFHGAPYPVPAEYPKPPRKVTP